MSHSEDFTRIRHVKESVQEILLYTRSMNLPALVSNRPLQHLIIRNLEILGEAASRISAQYRQDHPEIPWRDMIDLRNRLVHVYFDLNLDVIWKTVRRDLPELLAILEMLSTENHDN